MELDKTNTTTLETIHSWLYPFSVAFSPGAMSSMLEEFMDELLQRFKKLGHKMLARPEDGPDVLLTTALYNHPVGWRDSLFFSAKRKYKLSQMPNVITIVHITPAQYHEMWDKLERALKPEKANPADYTFPGITPKSYYTLHEQGRRGGPLMSAVRLMQAQTKCVRIILVVGENHPEEAYTFDLVGGYPRTPADDPQAFYTDLVYRIATATCTREITSHEVVGEVIPAEVWRSLATPLEMKSAGLEFGKRHFFTEMVNVANLVDVPVFGGVIASQYSEGCYSTWDPQLDALVTTITGSARPVDKGHLTDDELAVIDSVRPDGLGSRVRQVEGKRNDPPSSEAVELIGMDRGLPRLLLDLNTSSILDIYPAGVLPPENGHRGSNRAIVPVVRSKLHGHRGVKAYDPRRVEHIYLDKSYYHYPVSCSTEAQAKAIQSVFKNSEALQNPHDPRQVVFTILPGHGIVVVEKWLPGKVPFQAIWELMDSGDLDVTNYIPQGPLSFVPGPRGNMVLEG